MRKMLSNINLDKNYLENKDNTRGYPDIGIGACLPHNKDVSPSISSEKVFSSVSRQSVMIKNLRLGINFKEEQNRTLCEINQNLSHILPYIHSSPPSDNDGWKLYLDSISHLTEKTYSNFPLFGHGFDPPIRVHLIKNGKALTFEFTICTLLKSLPFQSLLHSSVGSNLPSRRLLDDCVKSVLEEMLLVTKEKDKAVQLVTEYENSLSTNYKAIHAFKNVSRRKTFFERILIGITASLSPKAFSNA